MEAIVFLGLIKNPGKLCQEKENQFPYHLQKLPALRPCIPYSDLSLSWFTILDISFASFILSVCMAFKAWVRVFVSLLRRNFAMLCSYIDVPKQKVKYT